MVARAGTWSTRLTAVPPACPREAAHARGLTFWWISTSSSTATRRN